MSCRWFNTPQGCKRNPCKFSHDLSSASSSSNVTNRASTPQPARGSSKPGNGPNTQRTPVQLTAPGGVCRYFYNFGHCKLDQCKFRHVDGGNSSSGRPSFAGRGMGNRTPQAAVSPSPMVFTRIPASDALQHLYIFCEARFQFSTPFQMCKFVNLLMNAASKEDAWAFNDSHTFLELVTEPHGLSRIESILTFNPVVTQVNQQRNVISFSSTYVQCLSYFVSDFVLDSPLGQRVNALFGLIHAHFAQIEETVTKSMNEIISRKSFEDPPNPLPSGATIFHIISLLCIEYIGKYRTALREHASLPVLASNLERWFNEWETGTFLRDGSAFTDAHTKSRTIEGLRRQIGRLTAMVSRESASIKRKLPGASGTIETRADVQRRQADLLGPLSIQYEPAGSLREDGPRHDNDFEDITRISIPPTHQEVACPVSPFLPANIPGAPHHLPSESFERLLDIQFRLLREELTAPLRLALQNILSDLQNSSKKTSLQPIISKRGGRYHAAITHTDSVMVNLYTNVDPIEIMTDKRGITISLMMDAPPGAARQNSSAKRADYWKAVARKRLTQGGLVGVLWEHRGSVSLFFGLTSSGSEDIQASAKMSSEKIRLRIKFFDDAINLRVMEWCQLESRDKQSARLMLIEAPVMYESIRPFLLALQREPTSFPFSKYLVHYQQADALRTIVVDPPNYTQSRANFTWNLSCLLVGEQPPLHLDIQNAQSVEQARTRLQNSSRLDKSQADAMIECLKKEFCLIQGPPGTGKSYTGVEIMRVLLANNVPRILLIAFTNHALDHLLNSVLNAGITNKIVRLGSRSADERIATYSMEALERLDSANNGHRKNINKAYGLLRNVEKELRIVLSQLQNGDVSEDEREDYMSMFWPLHLQELQYPTDLVAQLRENEKGWKTAGHTEEDESIFNYWVRGGDIVWLQSHHSRNEERRQAQTNQFQALEIEEMDEDIDEDDDSYDTLSDLEIEDEETSALKNFLSQAGLSELPAVPVEDRSLDDLRTDSAIWSMSLKERTKLAQSWNEGVRQHYYTQKTRAFAHLKTRFEEAQKAHEECQTQARLSLLSKVDIIGCTTTGAAKLTSLLKGIRPSVLLVEEAGQVLEAHILGSLVQSIEHVIMIGDPLQLRPNISNYSLSMDHSRGKEIYKFDQSTMERLDTSGMGMSVLTVQRRMRPEISCIPRRTLYKTLEDNEAVQNYPNVRGMAKNMFFFHHTHAEGGDDEESMSKYNNFEIKMINALVQHLLRQGTYTRQGSIVVLCMYLGQLSKLREELRKSKISVVLDARDEEELRNQEGDHEPTDSDSVEVAEVKITDQVLLRTVDNFQGEEADIILLSLVRNPGAGRSGPIGFLKSPNRANVALTRARHGMYVFGNGDLLAQKSPMWAKVIEEFQEQDAYGEGLPISCYRHPDDVQLITEPAQIRKISPDGGCLRPCGFRLKCGHTCPSKCHADDEEHRFVRCYEPCRKACAKNHPCKRLCYEDCGQCKFPIPRIELDCGHVYNNAPCYLEEDRSSYQCMEKVEKQLPNCEHRHILYCWQDPEDYLCTAICGKTLPCCQKPCQSPCYDCQAVSSSPTERDEHKSHPCGRIMHCQHTCEQICAADHKEKCGTVDCTGPCLQSCSHHVCPLGCSTPCTPCAMACPWSCPHHTCDVPCGSPCVRLPCDLRCPNKLRCGHPCPSLCGEPCGRQRCRVCAPQDELEKVVDLILQLTLADLDPTSNDLDNITMTLSCGHTFTVETLDGHCELQKSYEWDETNHRWLRPILPNESFITTPRCPTCRGPIDSRRYGRITKRGNLDLLERNVATGFARSLSRIQQSFSAINRTELENRLTGLDSVPADFSITEGKKKRLDTKRSKDLESGAALGIVPHPVFGDKMFSICGIPSKDAKQWTKLILPLLRLYQQAEGIVRAHTAHVSAYQASLSMLYEQELQRAMEGPRPPREPEIFAMRNATAKIGMSSPKADTRFKVEAVWLSVNIRFLIGAIAEKLYEKLPKTKETDHAYGEAWSHFITFVYNSCQRDAEQALKTASQSDAYRQILVSRSLFLQAQWYSIQHQVVFRQSHRDGMNMEQRKALADSIEQELARSQRQADAVAAFSRRKLSQEVILETFSRPLDKYWKLWQDMVDALRRPSTFYQSVSEEELRAVIGSFTEYTHRGHWYTCPNGHIFTIGDCGGAVQTSSCNECGAQIGGSGHQTLTGIQQARGLEAISASQGVAASPWDWGRNV